MDLPCCLKLMSVRLLPSRSIVLPAFTLWAFLLTPALQAEEVEITLTADQRELTVGDPVALTLQVLHPPDTEVRVPSLPRAWGQVEVRAQSALVTRLNPDGTLTSTQVLEVTLFSPGEFQTPELPVTLRDESGRVRQAFAPSVSLTVVSVLNPEDLELRDIKPQVGYPIPSPWPWVTGGLGVGAVAGWWIYRRRLRRRLVVGQPGARIDPRSPHRIALDELTGLEELDLPGQGLFEEHYTRVADIVRRYLEGEFDIPAVDRTTDELLRELTRRAIARHLVQPLFRLLRDCDLVKFARYTPEVDAERQVLSRARSLIERLWNEAASSRQAEP